MTPNSLDSSTVFAYQSETTTLPWGQQKSGHNGQWSNCRCCASVWSSPCDTGYVLMLHIYRLKSPPDINKEPAISSNYGLLYIYQNHCHWVQADYLPHCPEWGLIGLHVGYLRMSWRSTRSTWSYGPQPLEICITQCPWPCCRACCHPPIPPDGKGSIVDWYWKSSNCFPIDLQSQLISDPW